MKKLLIGRCTGCGYLCEWEEVPEVNDPWSDGRVQCCPECDEGESFEKYEIELRGKL